MYSKLGGGGGEANKVHYGLGLTGDYDDHIVFSFTDEMVQDFFFAPDCTPGVLLPRRCVIPPDS